ncbi:MAG: ribosome maturation factor RimP [Nitrospirota bacterium]|nr:ribosome maturation factor RimP [Nitrospirota bacterium]
MKADELKNRIREIIEPVINSLGIELYDFELNKMKAKALLRVFIEKDGGVTIDDCEHVSREIEAVLDVEDPIPYSYVLEVSSPGLDRPLKQPKDFIRYTGSTIRVVTLEPVEKQTFFIGNLLEADEKGIVVLLPTNEKITVPYANISKARLEVVI